MPKAREVKKRIKGVQNIQEITRAMKLVAAARIKKAEDKVRASRPYGDKMKEILDELLGRIPEKSYHDLMIKRDVNKVLIVPVSGDKGLCGAFNSNIFRYTEKLIKSLGSKEIFLVPIGNKAYRFYSSKNFNIPFSCKTLSELDYDKCIEIIWKFVNMFLNREIDEIYIIYARFVSTMSQETTEFKLLPFTWDVKDKNSTYGHELILEPSTSELLNYLLPKYLEVQFYQILLEAIASELGARLMAMTNATDNAEELINELTLRFYRARQEAITTEIIEVTSGSEAIKI